MENRRVNKEQETWSKSCGQLISLLLLYKQKLLTTSYGNSSRFWCPIQVQRKVLKNVNWFCVCVCVCWRKRSIDNQRERLLFIRLLAGMLERALVTSQWTKKDPLKELNYFLLVRKSPDWPISGHFITEWFIWLRSYLWLFSGSGR